MSSSAIQPPEGATAVPEFDRGWRSSRDAREPFLSYVQTDPTLNWSDELEELHEEASRTHFIDQWTRAAILARVGPLPQAPRIADVGCSTGYLLEDIRGAYPDAQLIGIDLLAGGLRKAHELVPDARLLHADACSLPLADASVDGVVSANLLEHIADDRRALREMARVLKPAGRAVVVVPAGPSTFDYYDRFLGHQRRYARRELARKGREAGLEVVEDLHLASLVFPAFWLVKARNRLRFGRLEGPALAARVARDIASTRDSRVGRVLWRLEDWIGKGGVRAPWGVRSLTVLRRPESGQ
ncbi:MAG TPA: class I SAM-dependent methyltransferase [Solirubrobacteraceae bacterium]|jgi:SAM-dependent methyltransferase|nr:class I SAM-dependent methyltransferase [Solirubrobacteraceae bacterium]